MGNRKEELTGVSTADEEEAVGGAEEEAEQRRHRLVALVPVEGRLLSPVALVPVPLLAVSMRLRLRLRVRHFSLLCQIGPHQITSDQNQIPLFFVNCNGKKIKGNLLVTTVDTSVQLSCPFF